MNKKNLLVKLPKVDEILNDKKIEELIKKFPRTTIVDSIRNKIDEIRKLILNTDEAEFDKFEINIDSLVEDIIWDVEKRNQMSLRKVINATGVVLHTNLGRALISEKVIENLIDVASHYSTLEFDISSGKRGSRYSHVEEIICQLTGAEGALVVNNNAAAVLLVLNTIAPNKKVIVSRGQLVEIGGSFRVPEVMAQGGAILKEVGTTNKTHVFDYEDNIDEETAAILKVHTSNYKILGFTKEVDIEEMVLLGKKYDIPVIEDIGSGTLVDLSKYGLTYEPTVLESISKGADIVTFSGDKLLGGPQAGIIVGKKKYIEKMKKNQLTRALRVDKMTLTALEATFRLYLDEKMALENIPTLKMLTMDIDEIKQKAEVLHRKIEQKIKTITAKIIPGYSQVGGGAMPLKDLPTYLISLNSKNLSAKGLEELLRKNKFPIICRINDDKVLLDVRTIKAEEFDIIAKTLNSIENGRKI
ncbi:L-seryl-tRNA(Sec) selenium transferase [Paramaledivibacter caminithermalis]|uniref:L-seryl-tRNA(Sec) selenium transferase n=1 Tax=Paramaledivibacter caminithermalis (strain DSM 15212 / CIP 107654 / DViRD3) TaxID=1121301 RepID=A0A1M6MGN4_PARC5|nr:L-seryl-tRNA(Sec) selenium transferase [Paramaledivibacter caminithermalis]SHJ82632.1 L-seryl-tRNA(Sec) selenium transferase [Paramaledivibacter caminithermalis DSM 15212]